MRWGLIAWSKLLQAWPWRVSFVLVILLSDFLSCAPHISLFLAEVWWARSSFPPFYHGSSAWPQLSAMEQLATGWNHKHLGQNKHFLLCVDFSQEFFDSNGEQINTVSSRVHYLVFFRVHVCSQLSGRYLKHRCLCLYKQQWKQTGRGHYSEKLHHVYAHTWDRDYRWSHHV